MSQAERSASDNRADEILDRITGTFARKGLEGSSMQDLAGAAGMSVGNFYRYFPSKVALIAALVGRCAADVRRDFDEARKSIDPIAAMEEVLHRNLAETSDEEAAIWLQIDAAALLHPEIAAVKQAMDEGIRANVRSMLLAVPGATRRDPGAIDEMVDFLFLFCSGLFRQRAFEGGADFERTARRLTARLFAGVKAELGGAAPRCAGTLAMAV